MPAYKAIGIDWDTDGVETDLPYVSAVNCDSEDEVVDALSDKYGFCINSVIEIKLL